MIALKTRIFMHDGEEYRLVAGKPVGPLPSAVLEKLIKLGLVENTKPIRKQRRKK